MSATALDEALQRERRRQQALLQALWSPLAADVLADWLQAPHTPLARRGLQAYAANAGASAERALAAGFPTVQALVGEESFAALARACWRASPPGRGDLACFGARLPGFIEADAQLADVPYLADCARLDWLLAQAEAASDAVPAPESLVLLGEADPQALRLCLAPGFALLRSRHPVVRIWWAHRGEDRAARMAAAGAALQAGEGDTALVWRHGWQARALALGDADARFSEALCEGATLGRALVQAGEGFGFEAWLLQALRHGWVLGAQRL